MAVEHVVVGTGGVGTRFINHDYPNTDGLIAGTTKQEGHIERLIPEGCSLIPEKENVLID